jgi:hypothetical protein
VFSPSAYIRSLLWLCPEVFKSILQFHDLRHAGGTLSPATGATLKELMARLGHSIVRGDDLPARRRRS